MDEIKVAPVLPYFEPVYLEHSRDKTKRLVAHSKVIYDYALSTGEWVEISRVYYYDTTMDPDKTQSMSLNVLSHEMEVEAENKLLKAQLQAQSDRADFIEDCIAEMATLIYI